MTRHLTMADSTVTRDRTLNWITSCLKLSLQTFETTPSNADDDPKDVTEQWHSIEQWAGEAWMNDC